MARINVYHVDPSTGERTLAGWFWDESAQKFEEETTFDGQNWISVATGKYELRETLYRTKGGRWVLSKWSLYSGAEPTYLFVDDDRARQWLIRNGLDTEVEKYFGPVEEESGPGRPETGTVIGGVRLPADVLAKLDKRAAEEGVTRAEMIRRLIAAGLR